MASDQPVTATIRPLRPVQPTMVIINPAAGNGRARQRWPVLARALATAGLKFDCAFTNGPLQATTLARTALHAGAETIIVVGGDGTVNEVVNGFFEDGRPIAPHARLGVVCLGTGSDLIRSLHVPRGPAAGPVIAAGQTRAIDLGLATYTDEQGQRQSRYFVNAADLGLGGETARRVNRSSKALGGFTSFLIGAVRSILAFQPKQVRFQIEDGPIHEQLITMIIAANGRFVAGGMFIAPHADLTDGKFDVFIVDAVSKVDLIGNLLPRVYLGKHVSHPRVRHVRTSQLRVWSDDTVLVEMDGEQPGRADAEIRIVPRALNVIVGK